MNNCTITFELNGLKIAMTYPQSLLSDYSELKADALLKNEDILTILKNNKEDWKILKDLIEDFYANNIKKNSIAKVSSLVKKKGLVGNINLEKLQALNPNISFPEDMDVEILLLDDVVTDKVKFGRNITVDGKEVFILKNSEFYLGHFANYLAVKKYLQNNSDVFDSKSKEGKILEKIRKKRKLNTLNDVVEDFIIYNSEYSDLFIKVDKDENISAYTFLESILNNILQLEPQNSYGNQFLDYLHNGGLKLDKNFKKNTFLYKESKGKIFSALSTLEPIAKDFIDTFKLTDSKSFFEFVGLPIDENNKEELLKFFSELELKNTNNIFDALISKIINDNNKEFPLKFYSFDANNIYFERANNSIKNKYDITYNTIYSMEIIDSDYKGYKIYAQNSKEGKIYYYPSIHYLNENTSTDRFESIEEAKNYIEKQIVNFKTAKHSLHEYNFRKIKEGDDEIILNNPEFLSVESTTAIPKNTMIEVLDFPINPNTKFYYVDEKEFLEGNTNRQSFIDLINSWDLKDVMKKRILDNISNSEEIMLFLYDLNDNFKEDRSPDSINTSLNNIIEAKKLPKKLYFVESCDYEKKSSSGLVSYKHKFIPIKNTELEDYKKIEKTPLLKIILAIQESFANKFNVTIETLYASEILEKYPDIDVNQTKAFIRNGNIIINLDLASSSDLLHEYTHLLLGVLKSNPKSREHYEELMKLVLSSKLSVLTIDKFKTLYPNISQIDLAEEVFAEMFGNYVRGKLDGDLNNIFKENEEFLKKSTKTIFNLSSEDNLIGMYSKNIYSNFNRFSSDVATLLKSEESLSFSNEILQRKKTNWVNDQIKQGNIIENCNG